MELSSKRQWLIHEYFVDTCVFYLKQNVSCLQTLEGHSQNVDCITFQPELLIHLNDSEDETVKS